MIADPAWPVVRSIVIIRDQGKCVISGRTYPLSVHHIWPRSQGGGNNPENLVTLCCDVHDNICDYCSRRQDARVPEFDPLASYTSKKKSRKPAQWPRPRAYVLEWS